LLLEGAVRRERTHRFVKETNDDPKPFVWTADPDKIIVAVKRGYQTLCVDDPVEARAIFGMLRRGRVRSCVRPMLRGPEDRWP
jgi:hypothetical protein